MAGTPYRARKPVRIGEPRGRLVSALRRLDDTPARHPWDLGRRARAFMQRYACPACSPLNRAPARPQRPEASLVQGRATWAACGRELKGGARAIFLLAPALKRHEGGRTRWSHPARVADAGDTCGEEWLPPLSGTLAQGRQQLVERLRLHLPGWILGSGLRRETSAAVRNMPSDGAMSRHALA